MRVGCDEKQAGIGQSARIEGRAHRDPHIKLNYFKQVAWHKIEIGTSSNESPCSCSKVAMRRLRF